MSASPAASDTSIAARVRAEVERTIQRNIKGLDYLFSGDPAMGLTPKDTIYRKGTLSLYHYRAQAKEVYRTPVLLVMSLVSRYYILDLTPGQSFIEFLVKQGYDVYLIDWGIPRPEDKGLRLEDYILDFMPDCIARILADSGEPDLSMIGYCMGGMLAIMYAALYPNLPLKNLVCFTTPVNFDGKVFLTCQWTDKRYFDVDRIPSIRSATFRPELMIGVVRYAAASCANRSANSGLWDNMWNDEFVKSYRMFDRWANDQIPFPGECFRQTTKELMWENKLYKNELLLGGRRVNLSDISGPVSQV